MMRFESITADNEHYVDRIYAGDEEQYWVHYNQYWLGNSRTHADIDAKLIYVDEIDQPVGFIAYGQHYHNEELTERVANTFEIIHLVIDKPWQRRGYGRQATLLAVDLLRSKPDCCTIVIAHHPRNRSAHHLYTSWGFVAAGRNYDDDPLLHMRIM